MHVNPYGENLCRNFLDRHKDWSVIKHASSSAAAAALLEDPDLTYASLASKEAAEQYGLKIMDEGILVGNEVPIMQFLVATNLPLSQVNACFPLADKNISIYTVNISNRNLVYRTLTDENTNLLNVFQLDEDKLYIEVEGSISNAAEMGCEFLSIYPACTERVVF